MRLSPFIGLCALCQHVRVIKSAKGSFFIMCGRARFDPRFNKYPPLPVLTCAGYEETTPENCGLSPETGNEAAEVDDIS